MAEKIEEAGDLWKPERESLPMGREDDAAGESSSSSRPAVQCAACSQLTESTGADAACESCGARLNVNSPVYSGQVPELITGPEHFEIRVTAPVKVSVGKAVKRRYPRIPCRNVKACIQTDEENGAIVEVLNFSRGGLCFMSFERFSPGSPAKIALHYIEGGQNIFQEGRIVSLRRRSSDSPTEYGVEFSMSRRSGMQNISAAGRGSGFYEKMS